MIRNMFFLGGSASFAQRFGAKFPRFRGPNGVVVQEIPQAMLALVATAVRAA